MTSDPCSLLQDGVDGDVADDGDGVVLAMEHIILEAYRLMQAGQPQQAEYLLIEGPVPSPVRLPRVHMMMVVLICTRGFLQVILRTSTSSKA